MATTPTAQQRLKNLFAGAIAFLAAVMALTLTPTTASAADNAAVVPCEKGVTNPDGSDRTYQDYALCMVAELQQAREAYEKGDAEAALGKVGDAYFGWYENNLEPASMSLSGNRKILMEGRFTRLKLAIRKGDPAGTVAEDIRTLEVSVARDAMVLDGALSEDADESEGAKLLEQGASEVDNSARRWIDFTTAFTLLLREGLEALLVVAAIVLYLVKTGNKRLTKAVYLGVLVAAVASFLLALVFQALIGGAGRAAELIEGLTMFIAVGMLFYVSNWMLSKADSKTWQDYISGMVDASVSKGAARALVFVAFLAVFREGAELVLFYSAAFTSGSHSTGAIVQGMGAAVIVLAVIYVLVRYGGAKLPMAPIFYGTSILLFLMCLSFVGKGVAELKEGDVIVGDTNLPWMHYYFPDLGIYPWAETLLPQFILLVAAVWIIVVHTRRNRAHARAAAAKPDAPAAQATDTPSTTEPSESPAGGSDTTVLQEGEKHEE